MDSSTKLVFDEPKRFAIIAAPRVIRTLIPANTPGVYMLLRNKRPFYVGRSDTCIRRRLAGHPLLRVATHVVWEPCRTRLQAYRLESAWFHELDATVRILNLIHPAKPTAVTEDCPFCNTGDRLAWQHALGQTN